MLRLFRNFSIIPVFLRVFTMIDYWIWANAFSTHCCWWTSSSYCWLTTCPLPVRCPPHLLCLGPSVCVAWWQMTAASLQGHPVLWDWRRWDRQVFVGSRCPHSSSTTLCVTVCPCFCPHQTFLYKCYLQFSFVQFSCSVVSNSLRPHGLQYARLPCPSPTPGAYSNSCPLSQWCHPTISSSFIPFSFHLQSFPISGSFPKSQFFTSGDQSIGVSASASVLPMNIQDWSPLGYTGWIFLKSKGLSRVFSNTTIQKYQFWGSQFSL